MSRKERKAWEKAEEKMKRKDLLMLAGILAAALVLWGIGSLFKAGKQGTAVEIQVGQKIQERFLLSKERRFVIEGEGGKNVLVIENGTARISEADCPDGLCVRQGKISRPGESIVCLPHKVLVRIVEEKIE